MHLAISGGVLMTLLIASISPATVPIEPVKQQEPQVKAVKIVKKKTVKPVVKKTKAELKEELIAENPKNCNQSTHWIIYPNGSCKRKSTPVSVPVSVSPPAPAKVGCEQYRSLVEAYNWNVDTMMYAMSKESGCNANAVGDNYVIGGIYAPSCGLLQVRTLPGRPSCDALKDPATNIKTAYGIWQGQGYNAWSVLH